MMLGPGQLALLLVLARLDATEDRPATVATVALERGCTRRNAAIGLDGLAIGRRVGKRLDPAAHGRRWLYWLNDTGRRAIEARGPERMTR
jgi:hypothetical protein